MQKYYYDGPVMEFDFCVMKHWKATTIAPTERKARCNLAYRFKIEHGMKPSANVSIPGKLIEIGGYDDKSRPRQTYTQISIEEFI